MTKLVIPDDGNFDEPPNGDETVSLGSYASGGSRYRILRPIGKGGVGEVWLARDVELNREVAVKQLQTCHRGKADYRRRFLREVKATAALEHPSIIPVYDIGRHPDGTLFQVMRYFGEENFHSLIRDYHRDHPSVVGDAAFRGLLGHFIAACRAVAYAHAREVVHLDIKPANIVTGEFGETQVIDWGMAWIKGHALWEQVADESGVLSGGASGGNSDAESGGKPESGDRGGSRAVPDMTKPVGFRGTEVFAAPEQHRGRWDAIGPSTDVYGLGTTLFYLLADKTPFDKGCDTFHADVVAGHLHAAPKPWAPPALVAIARKAMAVDPAKRYASANDLADDVDRFLADEPVVAFPDPWQTRVWRQVKRHRTAVSTAAALLITSAIALGAGYVAVSRERDVARDVAQAARNVIADFIESVADDKWAAIPGTAEIRLEAVKKVVEEYPRIIEQHPEDPDLRYDGAVLERRCANLFRVLGKLSESNTHYENSRQAMEAILARHPDRRDFRSGWALLQLDTAEVVLRTEGPENALGIAREALQIAETVAAAEPNSLGAARTVAQARMDVADVLTQAGDIHEAATLAQHAVQGFATVTAADEAQDQRTRLETRLLEAMAAVVAARASFEGGEVITARAMAEQADRLTARLAANDAGEADVRFVRALALGELGRVLRRDAARGAEGRALLDKAIGMFRALVANAGNVASYRSALASLLCDQIEAALDSGKEAGVAGAADEAIKVCKPLREAGDGFEADRHLARAHALRGRVAKVVGNLTLADFHLREATSCYERVIRGAPRNGNLLKEANVAERLAAE